MGLMPLDKLEWPQGIDKEHDKLTTLEDMDMGLGPKQITRKAQSLDKLRMNPRQC